MVKDRITRNHKNLKKANRLFYIGIAFEVLKSTMFFVGIGTGITGLVLNSKIHMIICLSCAIGVWFHWMFSDILINKYVKLVVDSFEEADDLLKEKMREIKRMKRIIDTYNNKIKELKDSGKH